MAFGSTVHTGHSYPTYWVLLCRYGPRVLGVACYYDLAWRSSALRVTQHYAQQLRQAAEETYVEGEISILRVPVQFRLVLGTRIPVHGT